MKTLSRVSSLTFVSLALTLLHSNGVFANTSNCESIRKQAVGACQEGIEAQRAQQIAKAKQGGDLCKSIGFSQADCASAYSNLARDAQQAIASTDKHCKEQKDYCDRECNAERKIENAKQPPHRDDAKIKNIDSNKSQCTQTIDKLMANLRSELGQAQVAQQGGKDVNGNAKQGKSGASNETGSGSNGNQTASNGNGNNNGSGMPMMMPMPQSNDKKDKNEETQTAATQPTTNSTSTNTNNTTDTAENKNTNTDSKTGFDDDAGFQTASTDFCNLPGQKICKACTQACSGANCLKTLPAAKLNQVKQACAAEGNQNTAVAEGGGVGGAAPASVGAAAGAAPASGGGASAGGGAGVDTTAMLQNPNRNPDGEEGTREAFGSLRVDSGGGFTGGDGGGSSGDDGGDLSNPFGSQSSSGRSPSGISIQSVGEGTATDIAASTSSASVISIVSSVIQDRCARRGFVHPCFKPKRK